MARDNEFDVDITLSFTGMTCSELTKLERYIKEGLFEKDWGPPAVKIVAKLTGERLTEKERKAVSKEDLLALEKQKKA